MSSRFPTFVLISILAVALASCRDGRNAAVLGDGDTLAVRHAERIVIVKHEGYTEVTLRNPWKEGQVLHRYLLVPRDGEAPETTQEATVVRVPLRRSAVFTTVHAALIVKFGQQERIAAVADPKYMKIPFVQEGLRKGTLVDCGDGLNPLVEKIIDAEADAILISPFENSGGYGRMEEIGIPIIECAEYMETSPRGRAEWMKFYGLLFGCEERADSLFAVVDSAYEALSQLALTASERPKVLMDKQTGSVWYVPGGKSTMGRMLNDAAVDYPFADNDRSGSLPLPFESVLEHAGESDVWLFRYDNDHAMTMQELLKEQRGYPQLRPVREDRVYGCNVRTSQFYEQSPFRPDYLLQDIIHILHPDLPLPDTLRYYQRVR